LLIDLRHLADNCHVSQCFSTFLLQGSLLQMFALFMEPYVCNDPIVYSFCNKPLKQWYWYKQPHGTVDVNFVPANFDLFWWNSWQPLAEPWLKNTDVSYICTAHCLVSRCKFWTKCKI